MRKLWVVFFILLNLAKTAVAAVERFDAESTQPASLCRLLSHAQLTTITVTSCLEKPVNLWMVSQTLIKTPPRLLLDVEAPGDDWALVVWNTLNEKGFPLIEAQPKRMQLLNYSDNPIAVYALKMVTVAAKETKILTVPPYYTFSHLTQETDKQTCLNIDTLDQNLRLKLETTLRPFWVAAVNDYDFSRLAFQGAVWWPFLTEFRDKVLPKAGINPKLFYQMIGESYGECQKLIKTEIPTENPRIPLIIHTIWLSDPNNPMEPKPEYSTWLADTMHVCSPKAGWQYILWVNCENLAIVNHPLAGIDDTLKPFVEVKPIKMLPQNADLLKIFDLEMAQKNYGAASDILRLVILKQQGGLYRDTDFKFIQSPLMLNHLLDFYSGMEGSQPIAACNAMIACKPNHPIIDKALELIIQGASHQLCPAYLKPYTSKVLRTLLHTGPMMLSIAFYLAAGREGNRDVLFPPEFFFWPVLDKTGMRLQTAGIHYHKASWL